MKDKKSLKRIFNINWVLINELAIGPAPLKLENYLSIKNLKIKSILTLCDTKEFVYNKDMNKLFVHKQFTLPDHKVGRIPDFEEIEKALGLLNELIKYSKPVFVHCYAAVERSPLLCMCYLIQKLGITPQDALEYLMRVNPNTNPLADQLLLLEKIKNKYS